MDAKITQNNEIFMLKYFRILDTVNYQIIKE